MTMHPSQLSQLTHLQLPTEAAVIVLVLNHIWVLSSPAPVESEAISSYGFKLGKKTGLTCRACFPSAIRMTVIQPPAELVRP